jgi:hypothetical protein
MLLYSGLPDQVGGIRPVDRKTDLIDHHLAALSSNVQISQGPLKAGFGVAARRDIGIREENDQSVLSQKAGDIALTHLFH